MSQRGNFGVQPPPPVDPRFEHLLARWESEVRSVEKQGWEAQKIAQEFAKLALSSALLLNGGALLALPPLMQWLSYQGREQVAGQAFWFLMGTVVTGIATAIAYANWMVIKLERYTQATKRARELDCDFIYKDVKADKIHIATGKKLGWIPNVVNGTALAAVAFAIAAYIFFGVGVYKFINLAERNTIAPITDVGKNLPVPAKREPAPFTPPIAVTPTAIKPATNPVANSTSIPPAKSGVPPAAR